jgi:GNAT superfamily N-acetyltransferase
MIFRDQLISTYLENPCQVLPNALWKTTTRLESMQTQARVQEGIVVELAVADENALMTYWSRDRKPSQNCFRRHKSLTMALVHQDYLQAFPAQGFPVRTAYFRLICRQDASVGRLPVPLGFVFTELNLPQEAGQAAALIGQCYPEIHPDADTVLGWSEHPTFDPALWIWLIDPATGHPAGLGIAEIDRDISEASLEWVQLLPAYQGRGLGKVLVQELLCRLGGRVRFTTVSGQVENTSHPEALYRSCGFEGNDVWWVLERA